MPNAFQTVGLIGRQRQEDISDTLLALKQLLELRQVHVIFETETAQHLADASLNVFDREQLGNHCDLIIVVGGDGNLLSATRIAISNNIPILGINRGRLGFLTDVLPKELNVRINEILDGQYVEEQRFLLTVTVEYQEQIIGTDIALNDVVLTHSDMSNMIEFSININNQFVCSQRSDGLIVATPTGSTAYALSGGGPILHPDLDAIVLVPMFAHTLSARPIAIEANSKIMINTINTNNIHPILRCDGHARIDNIPPGASFRIQKKTETLRLIHPQNYNYFATLRMKLGWNTKL